MAGIYLHIPFCKQACTYCNFHFSTSLARKDDMMRAIATELELARDFLNGATIDTIYFGGGTPSLLSSDDLNRLFDKIYKTYPAGELKEITLEANPDDLSIPYLKALRNTPVNRFSIGVQSFREDDLRYMNRAHNAQQAEYSIKAAQDTGFNNLSIDLIYGTPGLTDNSWKDNLQKMHALGIPHCSAYALTVEEGTVLHHSITQKKAAPVDAAQSAAQFELLMDTMRSMGYEHYEISNFAQPGKYAVHNTAYWQGSPYLGIGPSAHSFDGIAQRRWNVANNARYLKSIQDKIIPFEQEQLTQIQRLNEYIMTSLRTQWGCDLARIELKWNPAFSKTILENAREFITSQKINLHNNTLVLTDYGKLFADGIAAELFLEAER